ncbi:MAG TPA: 50S ribosomal protein L29 [Patescibacteria group bacterium]|nr:50S ribosomal protein L29 [Patescibacteria group bacterium]
MKIKERKAQISAMRPAEAALEIPKLEDKLRSLISGSVTGKIKNVRELKAVRRDIARLKSFIQSKSNI